MGLIIRQSIKASISNYAGLVIGYFNILILMPKVFSPEQIGINRFIIDISGVLAGFASLGLSYSMSRFFPKFNTGNAKFYNGFTFWSYSIAFIGFAMLCALLAIFGTPILNLLKDGGSNTTGYLYIIIPLTFIMLMTVVTEQYCALHGRIVVINVVRENGLRLVNLLLLILAMTNTITFNQFIASLLMAYLVVLLIDLWYLTKIQPISFKPNTQFISDHPEIKKDFLKFTGITLLGSIGPLLITRSDYFSVGMNGGDLALGIYAMALSIAVMTELPKRVILPIIQPVIARLIHEEKWDELKSVVSKANINQVLIGMAILLLLWFNADAIFQLMPNGERYVSGKSLILIIGCGKLIELFSIIPGIVINNSHYYRWNLFITLICLIAIFATYHFAVPVWGISGTALGMAVGYLTFAALTFLIVYKYYKMHWLQPVWLGIMVVFTGLILLNYYLPYFNNIWLNIFLRSGGLFLLFITLVIKFKFSQDLNQTIKQIFQGKFRWY